MHGLSVDYHLHTIYSDGTQTPTELVAWAKTRGITSMAITDHDGTGGLEEGAKAAHGAGIEFINGIELSTAFEGGTGLHILGYGIDPSNDTLREACEKIRGWRKERNEKLLIALDEEGYRIPRDMIDARFLSKPAMARAMVQMGYIKDPYEAFDTIFSQEEMRRIVKEKYDSYDGIKLIRQAGGLPVLAHPGKIRHIGMRGSEEFFANVECIVSSLTSHGLGGLECCYPVHTYEEKLRYANIAKKYGLTITRGSDFHGPELVGKTM